MHLTTHLTGTLVLTLAAALALAPAQAQELQEPAHAKAASGAPPAGLQASPLSGPMASAGIGAHLMKVEADPPTSRGGGGVAMERLFAARCRSVVLIVNSVNRGGKTETSSGTGSIVSINGHVLTAAHVVDGSDEVAVGVFPSCKPGAQPEAYSARVLARDPRTDLAILQLTKMPSDISVMPLGQLDEVRTGSNVVIIGHPRQLLMSMSQGLVSAVRPDFAWREDRRATVIQTDGALNPGNSGGPMMSSEGNLIGVNSFILGQASAGLNFAIAVSEVRSFIASPPRAAAPTARAPEPSPTPAPASPTACKTRTLKEWTENGVSYTSMDTNCQGKANALLAIPSDSSRRAMLYFDRNGDNKADVRIYLTREGKPDYSEWDDDYDGKYDFRGEHAAGEWAPQRKVRLG